MHEKDESQDIHRSLQSKKAVDFVKYACNKCIFRFTVKEDRPTTLGMVDVNLVFTATDQIVY